NRGYERPGHARRWSSEIRGSGWSSDVGGNVSIVAERGVKGQSWRPAMDYAAIDLHKTASQIRIICNGEIQDCRVPTTRDRWQLNVRDQLVWSRSRSMSRIRSVARMGGVHLISGHADSFLKRVEAADMPEGVRTAILPLQAMMRELNTQIAATDKQIAHTAE